MASVDCCAKCGEVIMEGQDKVRCAGPCAEVFHKSCAEAENDQIDEFTPQLDKSSSTQFVTYEVLIKTLETFKQELTKEIATCTQYFKNEFTICQETKMDHTVSEIKQELNELRIENEFLRTQNAFISEKLKMLEIRMETERKPFDEMKNMLSFLTKKVDQNSKSLLDTKDELKEVRNSSKDFKNGNADLVIQVRDQENKLNYLERALKGLTEKNIEFSKKDRVERIALHSREEDSHPSTSLATRDLASRPLSTTGGTSRENLHLNFLGNQPVTALAGIGQVYGSRLNARGYYKVSQIYEKFLSLGKNKALFESWLQATCGANSRWADQCYRNLHNLHLTMVPPVTSRHGLLSLTNVGENY